jgi:anti-sigma factor RsiW
MNVQPMVCRELVELVTEYLDDALPPDLRAAVVRHLDDCDGCTEYLRLMRRTVDELMRSPPCASLAAPIRHRLLDAFHDRAGGQM